MINKFIHKNLNDIGALNGFKKYLHNTAWLFSEKIIRLTIGLFIGIWVARYLGPYQFGILSYALSFVGLFTAVSTLGSDNIVIRDVVYALHNKNEILGTVFVLRIIAGIFLIFLIFCVSYSIGNNRSTHMIIIIIALSILPQSLNVIEQFFRASVKVKYFVWASITGIVTISIIRILFILCHKQLPYFASLIFVEVAVMGIILLYIYYHHIGSIYAWRFSKNYAARLLKDAWPLMFSAVMISIYMKIDQVMIQKMLGSTAVGQYSAAVKLSEVWYFIPVIICQSIFPSIINTKKNNKDRYEHRIQRLFDFMVFISLVIAIPISFTSGFLIEQLFGEVYQPAAPVLRIHVWSIFFVSIGTASAKWLLVENLQKLFLFNTFIGAFSNIVMNYILIQQWHIKGAAIATLISQAFSAYLCFIFYPKTRSCFYRLTKAFFFFMTKK